MTLSLEVEAEIRRLHYAEHWPVGTVSTQLRIHEEAVRRVLGLLSPRQRNSAPRVRLVDAYAAFITGTLRKYPTLRATRLYDMVRPRGYSGSVRTLRDYVREVRPRPAREAFLRVDPLPGEQAQVDWAYVGKEKVAGGERALWLFVIVLPWSRGMWGEFVYDTSVYSLLRSLVRAAAYFGGTPRHWLFDNPKTVVVERHRDAVRYHPLLLELAGHYRVGLRVCAVRKANQKGRVERAIRYLRERFLAGREVTSVARGNAELLAFIREVAHPRPHPTLEGRTVADCLAEEKGRLLALPETPAATDLVLPCRVDKTAFVRFDTNAYSVPPAHAQATLTLATDDAVVRVLDGGTVVARHARNWGRRQVIEAPEHRAALIEQKRQAREPKGQDRLRLAAPGIDALFALWVDAGRNVGSLTAQVIRLLDLYGDATVASAVSAVLTRGTHDPGAVAVVCEQLRRKAHKPVPVDVHLGPNVPDRDVIPHPLENYDARPRRRD